MLRFSKKLTRVGNSQGFILNRSIIKKLGINNDDWVEVSIKKILGGKK